MPASVDTISDPFRGATRALGLRVPQARVLAVLMPPCPDNPPPLWPVFTRVVLAERVGYTALSGSLNRALKGIPDTGSKTGDPHPGLLALGYVVEEVIDVCGREEVNYRATMAGVVAYRAWCAAGNEVPPIRPTEVCTNNRYRKE